jgi:hypothetical protein
MANNLIQIKRSLNTATPVTLANGELAFSANGNHLFIGSPNGSIIAIGGLQVPGVLTANQALVANATSGIDRIITANAIVTTITANGSTGTAGQILTSNGTVAYWQAPASSSFTITGDSGSDSFSTGQSLAFVSANGLTTAVTDNQVAFSVDSGSTLTVNATGLHVNSANLVIATSQLTGDVALGTNTSGNYVATITAGNGISGSASSESATPTIAVVAGTGGGLVSNSSGVFVAATDGLVANATGLHVGSGNGISTSTDAVRVTGGSTLTVNATGVHVNSALSITDLSLSGNLTVSGTLTTLNTTNLTVQDPLIKLANGNSSTDTIDIGFFGQYGSAGAKYAGLFRDASDSGKFKLFTGVGGEPTTTVDTADAGYAIASLQAYLTSGALTSNATNLALTANSTCNVAIVANNLSWSGLAQNGIIYGGASGAFTSLSAGAGGTVLMVSTSGVPEFAVLDGGTF